MKGRRAYQGLVAGLWIAAVLGGASRAYAAEAPASQASISPSLQAKLKILDKQAAKIHDLRADFVKLKRTVLLKKPLRSTGVVRVKGGRMRWDTKTPEPSVTLIGDKQLRLYQPSEHREEIYPITGRFDVMGASPIPQFEGLAKRFTIRQIPAADLLPPKTQRDPRHAGAALLGLSLTPRDKQVSQYVKRIELLIDSRHGYVLALRLHQQGDDVTTYRFSHIKINVDFPPSVFELKVPAGTTVSRPESEGSD